MLFDIWRLDPFGCLGASENSWAISFSVLVPQIASSATFALCWLVKLLRLFSLIACSFLLQATILNYCPEIGVHYTFAPHASDTLYRLNEFLAENCAATVRKLS